jgi:hypothetical protein
VLPPPPPPEKRIKLSDMNKKLISVIKEYKAHALTFKHSLAEL